MCGIFGAVGYSENLAESLHKITHRGPDDWGDYQDRDRQLYLGHRRLSILDLSRAGRQPMKIENPDIYITFNGEVYNYLETRETHFSDIQFQSNTDTEVILHLYRKFGTGCPRYLRGMFALAIFREDRDELFICRDRLGIKPLFYYQKDGKFAFSSELSSLKRLPGIDLTVDPLGLDYYFTYNYIPSPFTAYKYIRKLPPAHLLLYDVAGRKIRTIEPYWRLRDNLHSYPDYTEKEWLEAIEKKVEESVKLRLISDVPLGAFLSGGLDSSLVVSTMARLSGKPVKTFTIGFEFEENDERQFARDVADQYKTEHHVEVVNPNAIDILPQLQDSFGEPFADDSALPTYYVSQMARKNVTVVLSGDGGDEVFAGYSRYTRMSRYADANGIPLPVRKMLGVLGKVWPDNVKGATFLKRQGGDDNMVRLYHKLFSLPQDQRNELYSPDFKGILRKERRHYYEQILDEQNGFDEALITQLQLIDLNGYLPDDVLTKVDRMSMLHSLEVRVPLLDHELIELAFSCPAEIRFKDKTLKYIVKTLLTGRVSDQVIHHKKQGFGVPMPIWFRGEWKGFMESLISQSPDDYFLNNRFVNQLLKRHQEKGQDLSKYLYAILSYKLWHGEQ